MRVNWCNPTRRQVKGPPSRTALRRLACSPSLAPRAPLDNRRVRRYHSRISRERRHTTKALALAVTLLAFAARHWGALVFVVLLLLVVFVLAPRHMDGAMIAAGAVGTGVLIGHWWVG